MGFPTPRYLPTEEFNSGEGIPQGIGGFPPIPPAEKEGDKWTESSVRSRTNDPLKKNKWPKNDPLKGLGNKAVLFGINQLNVTRLSPLIIDWLLSKDCTAVTILIQEHHTPKHKYADIERKLKRKFSVYGNPAPWKNYPGTQGDYGLDQ